MKNTGSTTRTLTGWKLKDDYGWTYGFGSYKLGAGKTVTVHTGSGTNTAGHRYWAHGGYIWNNTGDTAKLRNKTGKLIDTCSFSGAGSYKVC